MSHRYAPTDIQMSQNRYPLAELTTIRLFKPVREMDSNTLLMLTDIIEDIKRVKRERFHAEREQIKAARKERNKKVKAGKKTMKERRSNG